MFPFRKHVPWLSKRTWLLGAAGLTLAALGGYWYVFVAGAPQLDPVEVNQNTGLTFQVESFNSESMGGSRRYGLVLPPGYDRSPQRRYPVIFLLHGGHGTEWDYEKKAKLTTVLSRLYKNHLLPPSILITPDGNDLRGTSPLWDSDYFDGPHGKVDTLIGKELVQVVKSRYRTLNKPQYWAMGGLSSGGWGAFNIGLRHLQQFHILFSHTGYFIDPSGPENSPQTLIEKIPAADRQHLRVYLDTGQQDEDSLKATLQFKQVLDRLGVKNEFHVFPGGHGIVGADVGWNYWHKHLADSLSFVGKQFQKAANDRPHLPHHLPFSSDQVPRLPQVP